MNWLRNFVSSSVGKKFLMAITGLMLCGFLLAHLTGNLLLYVGAQAYNDYAHTLHENEGLLMIAEVGLAALFVGHIYLAFTTARENREARNQQYLMKETKITDGKISVVSPETWMLISGGIVLVFLAVHMADFTFESRSQDFYKTTDDAPREPFDKAVALLQDPLSTGVYVVGCLVLWAHLGHGVASAFQTLGINHPKYNGLIKWGGVIFAALVGLGFALFPVWAFFQAPPVP